MRKDLFCLIFVCFIGIFSGVKKAYRLALTFYANSCHPLVDLFVPSHASVTRGAVFWCRSVLLVLAIGSQSKIFKPIVDFVAIYVVKIKTIRYISKQHSPNHSMKFVGFGVDGYDFVSRPMQTTRHGALNHV